MLLKVSRKTAGEVEDAITADKRALIVRHSVRHLTC
jgi:hypothetical protein